MARWIISYRTQQICKAFSFKNYCRHTKTGRHLDSSKTVASRGRNHKASPNRTNYYPNPYRDLSTRATSTLPDETETSDMRIIQLVINAVSSITGDVSVSTLLNWFASTRGEQFLNL